MKKHEIVVLFVCILIVVLLVYVVGSGRKSSKADAMYYAKTAVVTTFNEVRGYVGFTDLRGSEWYWYCDVDTTPWEIGDTVLLVMNSNNSQYIYDDYIISITTEGIDTHTVA